MQNQNPSRANAAPNVFIQQTPLPQHPQSSGGYYQQQQQQQQYGQPNPPNTYMGQGTGSVPMGGGMGGANPMMVSRPPAATSTSSYGMSPATYHQLQSPSVLNQLGSPPMFSGGPASVPPVGGPASVGPASVGPAPGSVPPPSMKADSQQQPVTPARSDAVDSTPFHPSQQPPHHQQQQHQQRVAEPPRPVMSTIAMPYSQEVLDRLDVMSPMALAMTARELVQEVLNRSLNLTNMLVKFSHDKQHRGGIQQQNDPEDLLYYCEQMLRRITEIRVRLDRLEQKEALTALTEDEYLLLVAQGGEQDDKTEANSESFALLKEQHRKAMAQYEQNRDRLLKLSSGLKAIEWEASVSAPILCRKGDRIN